MYSVDRSLKTYLSLDTQETVPKGSRGHYVHIHPQLQTNWPCSDLSKAHAPSRHKRSEVKVSVVLPKADRPNTVVFTQLLSHLSRPTTMDKWSHIDGDEAHVPPRHTKKKVKVSVMLSNTDELKAVVFTRLVSHLSPPTTMESKDFAMTMDRKYYLQPWTKQRYFDPGEAQYAQFVEINKLSSIISSVVRYRKTKACYCHPLYHLIVVHYMDSKKIRTISRTYCTDLLQLLPMYVIVSANWIFSTGICNNFSLFYIMGRWFFSPQHSTDPLYPISH